MATPSLQWDASAVSLKVTTASGGIVTMAFPDRSTDISFSMPITALVNPMTAVGDLIQGTTDGAPQRLAIGTNGQVLQSNGTSAVWATVSALNNPMTTAGDLIVGGTSGAPARLAKGTDTQVLTMVSGGVAWADATGGAGGFENPMTAVGDLILGGTAGAAGRLAIGTTGKVLTSNGTTASWEAATGGMTNPMTTAGDLIVGGTAGAATRLAIGTEGQVLKVVSGTPAWAADTDTTVEVYSDTETAIGTWLGSTLYRKAINIGSLPNAATKTVAHGISNIGTIVNQTGYMSNGTSTASLPYAPTSTVATDIKWFVSIYADATNVYVATSENRTTFSGYIILTYTKTA